MPPGRLNRSLPAPAARPGAIRRARVRCGRARRRPTASARAAAGTAAVPRSSPRCSAAGPATRRRRPGVRPSGTAGSARDGAPAGAAHEPRASRADCARPVCDRDLDLLAAATAGELLVFLSQLAPSPEQRALDHRARHPGPAADLLVGETLELAHHEQLVVVLGQAAERAAQILEALLAARARRAESRRSRGAPAGHRSARRRRRAIPHGFAGCDGTRRCRRSWRSRRSTA